jgi:hypothetical protein
LGGIGLGGVGVCATKVRVRRGKNFLSMDAPK